MWLNFKACKTPKVTLEDAADVDGAFFEKMFLLQDLLTHMDEMFAEFVKLRSSNDWIKTQTTIKEMGGG